MDYSGYIQTILSFFPCLMFFLCFPTSIFCSTVFKSRLPVKCRVHSCAWESTAFPRLSRGRAGNDTLLCRRKRLCFRSVGGSILFIAATNKSDLAGDCNDGKLLRLIHWVLDVPPLLPYFYLLLHRIQRVTYPLCRRQLCRRLHTFQKSYYQQDSPSW